MRLDRITRSASFRLAALQTCLLLVTFVIALAASVIQLRRAEFETAHAEIVQYEDDVSDLLKARGVAALVTIHKGDPLKDFRLEGPSGEWIAGGLPSPNRRFQASERAWFTFETQKALGPILAFTRVRDDGSRLIVGEYLKIRRQRDDALLGALAAFVGVLALFSLGVGAIVATSVMRRIDSISTIVDRYASGMRGLRLPVETPQRSDLDALAVALNDMMDRENRLVESIRQVSSSIAHDLRKPLSWHNQEIARALEGKGTARTYRAALVQASKRVDDVLKTFQSLLHIAELEAGAPGLGLEAVDLALVAEEIVEAYLPMAEAGGWSIIFDGSHRVTTIHADRRIVATIVANLLENALRHTPPGSTIRVMVDPDGPRLVVADDGPGVPEGDLERIFERFVRLDRSRSGPGKGLGLALVSAAVQAFGGRVTAENLFPGLQVSAIFDEARLSKERPASRKP